MGQTSPVRLWREAPLRYKFLGKKGKLLSFTKILSPAKDFESQRPYWVGVIKLAGGKKVTGQIITEGRKPKINHRVIGVFRRLKTPSKSGLVEYGVKFKLIS